MKEYFRPIVQAGVCRTPGASTLAGGWCWFDTAERITRHGSQGLVPARDIPEPLLERLTKPRGKLAGLDLSHPSLMGILNATPDSFSDGGVHQDVSTGVAAAQDMVLAGADIIDVGGESTRPGAAEVPSAEEIRRVVPLVNALGRTVTTPISIDTRKHAVAEAAITNGASLVNDVSGFTHDPALAPFCASRDLPVCVMHSQGDPETMQTAPRYDNVLLDVFDWLDARVEHLESHGIPRERILVDPGIGFGKTMDHNLDLLRGLSLFHGLGCGVLLGASRKRFIGSLTGVTEPSDRAHGSIGVALAAASQGIQVLRIHDVAETRAALTMWQAVQA